MNLPPFLVVVVVVLLLFGSMRRMMMTVARMEEEQGMKRRMGRIDQTVEPPSAQPSTNARNHSWPAGVRVDSTRLGSSVAQKAESEPSETDNIRIDILPIIENTQVDEIEIQSLGIKLSGRVQLRHGIERKAKTPLYPLQALLALLLLLLLLLMMGEVQPLQ